MEMYDMNLYTDRSDNNIEFEFPDQVLFPTDLPLFVPSIPMDSELCLNIKNEEMENYLRQAADLENLEPCMFPYQDSALLMPQDLADVQRYISQPLEFMTFMNPGFVGLEPLVNPKNSQQGSNSKPDKEMIASSFIPIVHRKQIGTLTPEERKMKIERYLMKRKSRNFGKKVSYACRKRVADSRIRIKGRFVTKAQAEALKGLENDKNNVSLPLKAYKNN